MMKHAWVGKNVAELRFSTCLPSEVSGHECPALLARRISSDIPAFLRAPVELSRGRGHVRVGSTAELHTRTLGDRAKTRDGLAGATLHHIGVGPAKSDARVARGAADRATSGSAPASRGKWERRRGLQHRWGDG